MTAPMEELAPWSTADASTLRHLELASARWDVRREEKALALAFRFRRQALEQLAERPCKETEDAVIDAQDLVEFLRRRLESAQLVEQRVTALVLAAEPAGSVAHAAAEVGHAHQA